MNYRYLPDAGRVVLTAVAVVLVALALAPTARAQSAAPSAAPAAAPVTSRPDSVLEAQTTAVATELRCAVCQGISIQESPSSLAREMRELVKDQLRSGRTPDEVKSYFVSKYGEWILLSPVPHGLNLLLYAAPVLLVLGGFVLIAVIVRRWTAVVAPHDSSAT